MLRIGVMMYQTSLTKGQELVAQRMVKELRRQGHEAFLITGVFHDWEPVVSLEEVRSRGGFIHLFDERLGIPVIRVNSECTSWPPRRIAFVDAIGNLSKIVDELRLNVVITHSTLWNGPEEAMKFAEWRRKLLREGSPHAPVLLCHMSHLQEASDERYSLYERSFRETWNDLGLTRLMRAADLVLVTTPMEGELMRKMGAKEEDILLFPGGIEDEVSNSKEVDGLRSKLGLPSSAKIISYLGTVEERKNADGVLKVAEKLASTRDVHFVIAGRLEGAYGEKVRTDASRLRNVTVTGPVTEREKSALIALSYLNLVMSRSEALGISQLEFMSAGVPVVTSGVGGQAWLVKDGDRGIVLRGPDDVAGAVTAVTRLLNHGTLRSQMGRHAAKFARNMSITSLVKSLATELELRYEGLSKGVLPGESLQGEEKVIEAWVSNGKKVAATTKRLIVAPVKSGKGAVAVPYNEIVKIARKVRAPWYSLALGAGATVLLLASRVFGLGLVRFLSPGVIFILSKFGLTGFTEPILDLVPFFPLAISIAFFLLAAEDGYVVHYGGTNQLYLPKQFLKSLRLADRLTPGRELFEEPT